MGFEGEEEEEEEEEEEAEDLMITLVQTVKEGKKPTSFHTSHWEIMFSLSRVGPTSQQCLYCRRLSEKEGVEEAEQGGDSGSQKGQSLGPAHGQQPYPPPLQTQTQEIRKF